MAEVKYVTLYNDRRWTDVTFVFDGHQEKAHRFVLAGRCDHFVQLFNQNEEKEINMRGTPYKLFHEVVNYCYLQTINISNWSYNEKKQLLNLATEYNFGPLMDFVRTELENLLKIPLNVENLNVLFDKRPPEEIRKWVVVNFNNIFNYKDCHKYTKDLIIFLMATFCEIFDRFTDKYKLRALQEKVLLWLFRWRNVPNRDDEDVKSIAETIGWHSVLVLYFHDSMETTQLDQFKQVQLTLKQVVAVRQFWRFSQVDTTGWTYPEVLQLLHFTDYYDLGPFSDALINVLDKEHLEPVSLVAFYDAAIELKSSKLQQMIFDYIENNTTNILSSAEFTNYPGHIVELVLESMKDTAMDTKKANLMLTSVWKWKASKSDDEVNVVFSQIRNFPRNQFADIFDHLFIDDDSKDGTFVFGEKTILAHKMVIAYSFDYYHKQLLDQSLNTVIKMDGTSMVLFRQVVKFCYNQTMDIAHWSYNKKCNLLALAKRFKYQSLMDFLETELKKRPESGISVMNLNEWFEMSPIQEINDWLEKSLFSILRNEHCGHYSKDLVLYIMETLYKMYGEAEDKRKFQDLRERLLPWLFCWKNSANKLDVFTVFGKVKWNLVPHKQLVNMTVVSMEKTSPDLWSHPLTEHSEFRGTKRKHE